MLCACRLSCLLSLATFFFSCTKDKVPPEVVIAGFTPDKGAFNMSVYIRGNNFDTIPGVTSITFNGISAIIVSVSDTLIVAKVPENASTGKIGISSNGKNVLSNNDFIILPGKWRLKKESIAPSFEGRNQLVSFVIGNKAYTGLGYNGGASLKDLWEYDPAADTWTRKADCGIDLLASIAMVINGKAYVGTGESLSMPCCPQNFSLTNQIWEYDPVADKWTRKADFPGTARWGAFGIGLNGKGYVGMGDTGGGVFLNDWWEYNPGTDSWTQKANLPPTPTTYFSPGFAIGNKIYYGTGAYRTSRNWFEYDPATNTWIKKADFPGDLIFAASGFVIGNKGYVAGGQTECWEFDPSANTWTQKAFFDVRFAGTTFSLNNKGYYVGGTYTQKDFWEFTP